MVGDFIKDYTIILVRVEKNGGRGGIAEEETCETQVALLRRPYPEFSSMLT